MDKKILLIGHEKVAGLALAAMAIQNDLTPVASSWGSFTIKDLGRRNRPNLVIAAMDDFPAESPETFCQALRTRCGENLPIFATLESKKFVAISRLLDAGFTDCLPPLPDEELFSRKVTRALVNPSGAQPYLFDAEDEIPEALVKVFEKCSGGMTLGDVTAVHCGVAPRYRFFRRMAPPDAGWRKVISGENISRFAVSGERIYLSWSRLHLFRLPNPAEYAVREKVVVRRAGPPIVAAVDRTGGPIGQDVYSLVPVEGVPAGFIACLLNSRIADFYFNRMLDTTRTAGRLKPALFRNFPLPEPDPDIMLELSKASGLLGHFGQNPQSWVDRQRRDEIVHDVEEKLFMLYGVGSEARQGLEALHY